MSKVLTIKIKEERLILTPKLAKKAKVLGFDTVNEMLASLTMKLANDKNFKPIIKRIETNKNK